MLLLFFFYFQAPRPWILLWCFLPFQSNFISRQKFRSHRQAHVNISLQNNSSDVKVKCLKNGARIPSIYLQSSPSTGSPKAFFLYILVSASYIRAHLSVQCDQHSGRYTRGNATRLHSFPSRWPLCQRSVCLSQHMFMGITTQKSRKFFPLLVYFDMVDFSVGVRRINEF